MRPVAIVQDACSRELTSEDGGQVTLELFPGLSEAEIAAFEAGLPCRIPADVRELLAFCRGFSGGAADFVDFTGRDCSFEFDAAFPHGLPIAADGLGNFWVVDLTPHSTAWAPIYFACHDAPVILFQSPSIEHFLTELLKCNIPPFTSAVGDVQEDRLYEVWVNNPGVLSHEECVASQEPELVAFAQELGPSFQLIDLRNASIGCGFSWGRYGPDTVVRRFGTAPIFAYQATKRKGLLARLFGRSP